MSDAEVSLIKFSSKKSIFRKKNQFKLSSVFFFLSSRATIYAFSILLRQVNPLYSISSHRGLNLSRRPCVFAADTVACFYQAMK